MTNLYSSAQHASAVFEITPIFSAEFIISDQYFPWLQKWEKMYKSHFLPPLSGIEGQFHEIYYHLNELRVFLSFAAQAEEAIQSYEFTPWDDEKLSLSWLVKHENMHKELGMFIYNTMCAIPDDEVLVIDTGKVKVSAIEFIPLIKFCNLYHPLYFENLKKYSTYTPEEEAQLDYNGEEGDQYLSLTFQLKKSGFLFS